MHPYPHLQELVELRRYARSLGMPSQQLVSSSLSGLYASVFRGQGLNFEEVREYREGDDIRNMDWKVTARTGKPHLKVFQEERERTVVLCVDKGAHMHFGTRKVFKSVQAARAAALLGWAANSQHDRVGGMLFGGDKNEYFRPSKDRRAIWRLLRQLSDPVTDNSSHDGLLADALRQAQRGAGTGGLVFIIADFNHDMPDLEHHLLQLRDIHSVVLIPIDDPADERLPDMGQVLFRDPSGEIIEVDTGNAKARENYARSWRGRRAELQRLASRLRIALIPIRTDDDVHLVLMKGLEKRARQKAFQ